MAVPSLSSPAHIVISLTQVITSLQTDPNMLALVIMFKRWDDVCTTCKEDPWVFIRDTGKEEMYREFSGAANELLRAEGGMDVFIKEREQEILH